MRDDLCATITKWGIPKL